MRGSVPLPSMPDRRTVWKSNGVSAARAGAASASSTKARRARRMRMAAEVSGIRWVQAACDVTLATASAQPGRSPVDRALGPRPGADDLDDVVEVVADDEEIHVLPRDHPVGQGALAQPVDQAAPVRRVHEADGELADLAGLDEGQGLEELVERAEAAWQDHERVRV